MKEAFTLTSFGNENKFTVVADGVSAFITLPEANYTGDTMAVGLQKRINQMVHPVSGMPIGGVKVAYNEATNSLSFTSGTATSASTLKIEGDIRFGLKMFHLGLVRQLWLELQYRLKTNLDGRCLYRHLGKLRPALMSLPIIS